MSIDQSALQSIIADCQKKLENNQGWLATAESITGGGIGAAWTSLSGSSKSYLGGIVAYQDDIKTKLLSVPAELLASVGAVSEQVAGAMLQGLWSQFAQATSGIAVTGFAQGGAQPGLVWLAVGLRDQQPRIVSMQGHGDRQAVRLQTCELAYQMLSEVLDHKAA